MISVQKIVLRTWAFFFLLATFHLVSAIGHAEDRNVAAKSEKLIRNVPYRQNSESLDAYAKSRCVLDISLPETSQDFPTIIWFHGGGLTGGEKHIPAELRNQGFAVIGAGYRLSPHVKVADCIDDAAAAIDWVLKNISSYGGSPKKVIVSGHSAGGYLGMMVGLNPQYLKKYGSHPDQLAGLAPFSGQAISHFTARQERGIPQTQPVVDELAPLFFVRKDCPPVLILSGDREKEILGRYEENAYLARMLKVAGHKDVTLIEYPGTDHGTMVPPGYPDLLKFSARVTRKTP